MIIKLKKPIIGFKKVRCADSGRLVIVKLEIPKGALVRSDVYRDWRNGGFVMTDAGKKRASSARVLSITAAVSGGRSVKVLRTEPVNEGNTGGRRTNFVVGKKVRPHEFDPRDEQCAGGIHFYLNRYEALGYFG